MQATWRASSTVLSCFSRTTGRSCSKVETFVRMMSSLTSLLNSFSHIIPYHSHHHPYSPKLGDGILEHAGEARRGCEDK